MNTPITVKDIIIKHLNSIKADGLVNTYIECGCDTEDLIPCNDCITECTPGKKDYSLTEEELGKYGPMDWIMRELED